MYIYSVHTHKAGSSHSSVDTHMNGNSSSDMNVNSHHTWMGIVQQTSI